MNYFADFNTQLEFDESTLVWDYSKFPPKKIQVQINLTKNNKINYIRDGATLRIDQVKDSTNKYQIFQNFEQIEFFNRQETLEKIIKKQEDGQPLGKRKIQKLQVVSIVKNQIKILRYYTLKTEKNKAYERKQQKTFLIMLRYMKWESI
ncbi:unnamed protein product [Paramecium primaurelia]|uniref:Uncharacterized protein n=1 Tax=Paramecium primaurelia TaxID=5886 RepID=A0A8S1LGH4_PARPR|nr:unnamed protein product [Paramecium primaurelia]